MNEPGVSIVHHPAETELFADTLTCDVALPASFDAGNTPIHPGTAEMLLDDATRLAHHAVACGVPVELELWENMVHVWQMLDGIEPRARAAVRRAGLFGCQPADP